jgi:hypothetical protein
VPVRLTQDRAHLVVDRVPLPLADSVDGCERADPRSPEDLVAKEVAEPGDQLLVHQRRLDPAAPARKELVEVIRTDGHGVRAERTEDRLFLGGVSGKPDTSEPAHVPVAQLASRETEHDAVVRVAAVRRSGPGQKPSHAEVHEQFRSAGIRDEPFAVAACSGEATALEGSRQRERAGVADQRVITYVDRADSTPGGVAVEVALEPLDVRKLRHRYSMALKAAPTFRLSFTGAATPLATPSRSAVDASST